MIEPGKHLAKIESCGVQPPREGHRPSVFVKFRLNGSGDTITFFGNMDDARNPTAKMHPFEVTIKSLVVLGLQGKDPYALADNNLSMLDTSRDYELVIEENNYQGKTSLRVKYINLPRSGTMETISHNEAKGLAGYDFSDAVLRAQQEQQISESSTSGASKSEGKSKEMATPSRIDYDDIPF